MRKIDALKLFSWALKRKKIKSEDIKSIETEKGRLKDILEEFVGHCSNL